MLGKLADARKAQHHEKAAHSTIMGGWGHAPVMLPERCEWRTARYHSHPVLGILGSGTRRFCVQKLVGLCPASVATLLTVSREKCRPA